MSGGAAPHPYPPHLHPTQAVQRAIQSHARPIRIPAYMTGRIVAIRRTRALAYYATGMDPAEEEIAGELQLSSSKVC